MYTARVSKVLFPLQLMFQAFRRLYPSPQVLTRPSMFLKH